MDMAGEIKTLLTMRQVAEYYGFDVSRSGFVQCPFHRGDRTASLKIYDGSGGWHCFGCGKGGSVIDFTMELFGLNFRQATLRLNSDFRLGLSASRPDRAAYSKALEARRRERQTKEQREKEFRMKIRDLWYYRDVIAFFRPVRVGDNAYYHPMYIEAVKRLPYIEYWLDDFIEEGGKRDWTT